MASLFPDQEIGPTAKALGCKRGAAAFRGIVQIVLIRGLMAELARSVADLIRIRFDERGSICLTLTGL
jgi:hypothetical protein